MYSDQIKLAVERESGLIGNMDCVHSAKSVVATTAVARLMLTVHHQCWQLDLGAETGVRIVRRPSLSSS